MIINLIIFAIQSYIVIGVLVALWVLLMMRDCPSEERAMFDFSHGGGLMSLGLLICEWPRVLGVLRDFK